MQLPALVDLHDSVGTLTRNNKELSNRPILHRSPATFREKVNGGFEYSRTSHQEKPPLTLVE